MSETSWWTHGIIYQIYPRSFQDSNGDGIGDLRGIQQRLDYLAWLGVNAIWISPVYPSPMADFGYDIADYCAIDPMFGSMPEFEELVREAHSRGLRVILDLVPNHTSDQHPWFLEARRSRTNPKRDWYIWKDPGPGGGPPNNWISNFGGSAWEWDEATGQYFYHAFLKEQPDLNWRNPQVRTAIYDVMRFWLDRGVDGFRVDVMWHLIKDDQFRDNPPNPSYDESRPDIQRYHQVYSADQPEVHDVVAEMRAVMDEYDDRVLIGEIYLPIERLVAYYGQDLRGAHLPFNFQLIQTAWDAGHLASLVQEYEAALPEGGWPNWVLGNHDKPRIASRVGQSQARVAAMLLLTLRGTPTMYYGDEIGMQNVPIPADAVQDPWEKNEPGLGIGRDPQRTPMQWDRSANAGFTSGTPWLPIDSNARNWNVEALSGDPRSILSFYRRLIELRASSPALRHGSYGSVHADGDVLTYERRHDDGTMVIVLNLGHSARTTTLHHHDRAGRIEMSTYCDRIGQSGGPELSLRPDEGLIISYSPAEVETREFTGQPAPSWTSGLE